LDPSLQNKQVCLHLLLIKRYNLYKVLACSTTFFHLSLLCATFFQMHMFMLFISSKTSSSQRVLGLPIGLLDMGFQPVCLHHQHKTKYNCYRCKHIRFLWFQTCRHVLCGNNDFVKS
jgi:hypothetical protein